MKRALLRRVGAGLSLLSIVAATAAVPAVLTTMGGLPTLGEIRDGIALRYLPARLLLQLLTAIAWIAYAYLIAWFVADLSYRLARRQVRRAPARWARPVTARMAGLALVALGRVGVPSGHASLAAQPIVAVVSPIPSADTAPPPALPAPLSPVRAVRNHRVRKGDNLWDLAEDYYGDGRAWRKIWTANGETVPDPRQLRVGQVLDIPDVADGGEPAGNYEVRSGDSLWSIARDNLGAGQQWPKLWEANRDRPEPDGTTFEDPAKIHPGWTIQIPKTAAPGTPGVQPPPVSPLPSQGRETSPPEIRGEGDPKSSTPPDPGSVDATTTTIPASVPVVPGARAADSRNRLRSHEHSTSHDAAGLLGVAGTLLAVGLSLETTRRRRRRQLHTPPHMQPPPPPSETDQVRVEVAATADHDRIDRLDHALRDVAGHLASRRSTSRPRLVQVDDERIEIFLSHPTLPAPPKWRPEGSGSVWTIESESVDALAGATAEQGAPPCPVLVTLGRADATTEMYLDLEAEGLIAVTGDGSDGLVRAWCLELATSPLARTASVVVVGDRVALDGDVLDRVRVVESWDEISDDVVAWVDQSAEVLRANRWSTPLVGRTRGRHADALAPLVVVLPERPEDERFDRVCRSIANRQVAVTIVVVGDGVEGATEVRTHGPVVDVPALGLSLQVQELSTSALEQVETMLGDAAQLPSPHEYISRERHERPAVGMRPNDVYEDPPHDVLVRVLGEIHVEGGTKTLTPKQTAVLAYIALHAPVPSEAIEDAVWVAPTESRKKRLANTVSECRAALGAQHLPIAADGRYRVGPNVVTDVELFERRVSYAEHQEDIDAVNTLRGALELVEGPVFTYRNADRASYVWVDVENWHSTWELKVADAAEDLARRCLDLDDVEGAVWAAARGLKVSPTHPRLTRVLMEAYSANGDRRAAARVFESYQAAIHQLEIDDVDPDLVDFYAQLRHDQGRAAS